MTLPFFYQEMIPSPGNLITLEEETSRHIVQVLRMRSGDSLQLTDGNGNLALVQVADGHKKHCLVKVEKIERQPTREKRITIAISLLKNAGRFEWFLEKAAEIGVSRITPLVCERTERDKIRIDRLRGICISAMLQSQQVWLTQLDEPLAFENILTLDQTGQKLIAHCEGAGEKKPLQQIKVGPEVLILIGPEGDFTSKEILHTTQHHFIPVSLGTTRLRTETAGLVAASLLCNQ